MLSVSTSLVHSLPDDYTKGLRSFSVVLKTTFFTLNTQTQMFFQADNLQSTAVRSLKLNPATNQALVEYVTSAKTFLYENIDADAIVDFFFGEIESAGKFVNAYCKGNQYTVVG